MVQQINYRTSRYVRKQAFEKQMVTYSSNVYKSGPSILCFVYIYAFANRLRDLE